MFATLDVHYHEPAGTALAAAVLFEHLEDAVPFAEYTAFIPHIEPYQPGEFYKRELPCLLALLQKISHPLSLLIIDGYVTLGPKPGLGQRLYEALDPKLPIIGVAKTRYASATPIEVMRGGSQSPLFITAVGIDPQPAADNIRRMHGPHRIPTLLKRVDQLARKI